MSTDKCSNCGKKGHFALNCYISKDKKQNYYKNKEYKSPVKLNERKKIIGTCFRCGRKNHYANNCYAGTHIDGNKI
jgi:hypothetical protein